MHQLMTLFVIISKNYLRDKQSIFLTLAFPLVFLLIFGFVYGGEGEEPSRLVLGLYLEGIGDEESSVLNRVLEGHQDRLQVERVDDRVQLEEGVQRNRFHFGLVFSPSGFDYYYNPTRIQSNLSYQKVAHMITMDFNQTNTGLLEFIQAEIHSVSIREKITQLDYLLPGIIALGILSTGLFSITGTFMHFREKGVLKRLAATPIKRAFFLGSIMVTRVLVSFLSSFIILGAGRLVFGLTPFIHWPLFCLFLLFSTLSMMGLGFFITLFARSAQNATEMASILLTIMIFFSGIYIPLDFLSGFLQTFGRTMPLYYMALGFRSVMNVETIPAVQLYLIMAVMLVWTISIILFTSRKIPWERRI